jgi:predicted nucleic acid-binding protein
VILFDTNIFIDMLSGHTHAAKELISYPDPAISVITMMELRAGQVARPGDAGPLDALLDSFTILPIDVEVSEMAVVIRGKSLAAGPKVKLPDAIIGATAEVWCIPIVTRNPRDFAHVTVPVHVPYEIDPNTGVVTNVRSPYGMPPAPTFTRLK